VCLYMSMRVFAIRVCACVCAYVYVCVYRALNAVKWDKVFAKPFVCAFDCHSDGIWCMSTHPTVLTHLLSGACDGGACVCVCVCVCTYVCVCVCVCMCV